MVIAFLGAVAREQPEARTRVDAAKRALNFVRAIAGLPLLDKDIRVSLLAKTTRERRVITVRQSPQLLPSHSTAWWKVGAPATSGGSVS